MLWQTLIQRSQNGLRQAEYGLTEMIAKNCVVGHDARLAIFKAQHSIESALADLSYIIAEQSRINKYD